MKKEFKNIINDDSMKLFWMLCGYFLLVLVFYTMCNFLKFRNCLGLIQALSVSIPIIFYCFSLSKKKKVMNIIGLLGVYFFLLLLLPFLSTKTFDLTCDGNYYHKSAIGFIKNGWNPLYETAREFQAGNDNVFKIAEGDRTDLWMEHYPKATWVVSAVMYDMTNNIESGKSINLIFAFMFLLISYNCLKVIFSKKCAFVLALLLVLNPVFLAQVFSYYVDGLMGVLFGIEFFLLLMIDFNNKQNKIIWMALVSICTFFVNLKFSGLLASGVVAAIYYFYWFFKYRTDKEFWNKFKTITINFVIVFSVAIFFIGSSSYVKNTFEHKNPLYPLFGKEKVDIITTMQPKSFTKKNKFEKFVISTFSRTENVIYGENEPILKLPIKVYKSEISELGAVDVRIGGFGPLFALLLIISIPILIINSIIFLKKSKEKLSYLLLPFIAIIGSSILLGEAWWARYIPQLYFLIIGAVILVVYNMRFYSKKKFSIISLVCIGLVILLNTGAFLYVDCTKLKRYISVNREIDSLKYKENLKLRAVTRDLIGCYYNLSDRGVKFTIIEDDIPEEKREYIYMLMMEKEENEE